MLRNIGFLILALISLGLSQAVKYTEVLFIDFTKTPQSVNLFFSWIFLIIFVLLTILSTWWFVDE